MKGKTQIPQVVLDMPNQEKQKPFLKGTLFQAKESKLTEFTDTHKHLVFGRAKV